MNGSASCLEITPLLLTVENSLEVILSKIPIDHPFFVFPLNFAAPKIVVFLGLSINEPVDISGLSCGLLPIRLEKNKLLRFPEN